MGRYLSSFVLGVVGGGLFTFAGAFELGIGFRGTAVVAIGCVVIGIIYFFKYLNATDAVALHRTQWMIAGCCGFALGWVLAVRIAASMLQ